MPLTPLPKELHDFRNFLFVVWDHLRLPEPTTRQYEIAEWMQNGPQRLIVEGFRGIAKSWIAAAFAAHQLRLRPDMNILVVSASKARADNFTTFLLRLIDEMPVLQGLYPLPHQRCSKVSFDVAPAPPSQTPSVTSLGITSQITGNRADLIIPDDVEVPSNSQTQHMRERLSEQVKEFDAVIKPGGRILALGTPQCEDSIYPKLQDRGFVTRIWPARYPTPKQILMYGERLSSGIAKEVADSPALVGTSTEPTRFTDADLAGRELSYGRAGFALQYMLDTRMSDLERYPLKLRDLIVLGLNATAAPEQLLWASNPEQLCPDLPAVGIGQDRYYRPILMPDTPWSPYQGIVMAIDPSGRGADETSWAVAGHKNGLVYALDAGGTRDGYGPATLATLAETAKRWAVNRIIVEANYGDGMFTQLLKPVLMNVHPCAVEEVKHSTQKEKRILDTLEPLICSHRLVVNRDLIQKDYDSVKDYPLEVAYRYRLMYQLTRITRDRGALANDDRLDALAMAVAHFTQQMALEHAKEAQKDREQRLQAELEKFMRHCLGVRARQATGAIKRH